jgi:hypothetical protein
LSLAIITDQAVLPLNFEGILRILALMASSMLYLKKGDGARSVTMSFGFGVYVSTKNDRKTRPSMKRYKELGSRSEDGG